MLERLRLRLELLTPGVVLLVVSLPLFGLYFATASKGLPYHIDAMTNALSGWHLAAHGSFYLDEAPDLASQENFQNIGWFVRTPSGHVVSQYPPGAALVAAPFYLVYPRAETRTLFGVNEPDSPGVALEVPSLVPAAVAASLATALAVGFLTLTCLSFLAPSRAVVGGYVIGLGTGAWAVASNALWQHGPAMLWIAVGLFLASRRHLLGAGLAFGMAIFTRPHTALIAAGLGLALGIARRTVKPVIRVAIGSSLGLAAVVVYNWIVFGTASISGGYGSSFTDRALSGNWWWYLRNVAGALFDPAHGLLIWAPFLVVLIPGLIKAWKIAPDWVRGAAVGGLLYLLLQLKANRFSGGDGHFAYRYPLEMLAACAPLLVLSWREWVSDHPFRSRFFSAGVILAVVGQAIGAVLY